MHFPDVATPYPDKKSILMYVTSLFQVLPQQVTLEAIQEVETLPRQSKHIREEHVQLHQQRFSQQVSSLGGLILIANKVIYLVKKRLWARSN